MPPPEDDERLGGDDIHGRNQGQVEAEVGNVINEVRIGNRALVDAVQVIEGVVETGPELQPWGGGFDAGLHGGESGEQGAHDHGDRGADPGGGGRSFAGIETSSESGS